jgi:hypothetical protein
MTVLVLPQGKLGAKKEGGEYQNVLYFQASHAEIPENSATGYNQRHKRIKRCPKIQ